ncbi:tRNA (adenosine(37)-N6)-threonylcarbamoyltransferase complex dimerization subunit type 1 TsaB [Acetobacteraceae bacterium H6797]|nr:tRNA (adenosine(37)-N6)-threonylcarbamoyltransferase complex dimerization subunit type 1 TsaB [Acetobacteraceae bacterium H6797]
MEEPSRKHLPTAWFLLYALGMRILTIDGALARCSAALWQDGALLAEAVVDAERGHPSTLPPLVERVMAETGAKAPELDAVAVVVGPGGFTGLRAALSLAEGLALAAGIPAIGVTTGEAMAASLPARDREAWMVLDARRGRVLLERIPLGTLAAAEAPLMTTPEALPMPEGPVLLLGDAAPLAQPALAAKGGETAIAGIALASTAGIATVAAARLRGEIAPRGIAPLYGEPPSIRGPGPKAPA